MSVCLSVKNDRLIMMYPFILITSTDFQLSVCLSVTLMINIIISLSVCSSVQFTLIDLGGLGRKINL